MTGVSKQTGTGEVIALALTWDGARWPLKSLSASARAFLTGTSTKAYSPPARRMAKLLAQGQVRALRICWVPRLRGGDDVLATPFNTGDGKRIAFRVVKTVAFDDCLGVVYRRG